MSETDEPMGDANVLLSATDLRIAATGTSPVLRLSLSLEAGDLHLIHTRDRRRSTVIGDVLLGIEDPGGGRVRYLGHDWSTLDAAEAFRLRRTVGRIQATGNWIGTRSVMDNMLLPVLHHSLVPPDVLQEQAGSLARRFGLPGLPTLLPDECAVTDLQRAACVRAFLGRPALVILEYPIDREDPAMLAPLMIAIQQVRRRGGAVLWFTQHLAIAADHAIPADRRLQIVGAQLQQLGPIADDRATGAHGRR